MTDTKSNEQPDESAEIAIKHRLVKAVLDVAGKGYDNEYAVAFAQLREVFDSEVLPHMRAPKRESLSQWQPIETAPKDIPIILANFPERCLMSGAPHVWTARLASKEGWVDGNGNPAPEDKDIWLECSHAAMNENGTATHWMHLPANTTEIEDEQPI